MKRTGKWLSTILLSVAFAVFAIVGVALMPAGTGRAAAESGNKLVAMDLGLDGEISLKYYFTFDDETADDENAFVSIAVGDKEKVFSVKDDKGELTAKGDYEFAVKIAAKQMSDVVVVKLYTDDGTDKTVLLSYGDAGDSVASVDFRYYAQHMLKEGTDEQRAVIRDMLNYGAACQTLFGYNEGDLVSDILPVEDRTVDVGEITTPDYDDNTLDGAVTYAGLDLISGSTTKLVFYLRFADGENPDWYDYRLTYVNKQGNNVRKVVNPAPKGDLYTVTVDNVPAYMLDTPFVLSVQGEGSVTRSVNSYLTGVISRGAGTFEQDGKSYTISADRLETVKALYAYGKSANKWSKTDYGSISVGDVTAYSDYPKFAPITFTKTAYNPYNTNIKFEFDGDDLEIDKHGLIKVKTSEINKAIEVTARDEYRGWESKFTVTTGGTYASPSSYYSASMKAKFERRVAKAEEVLLNADGEPFSGKKMVFMGDSFFDTDGFWTNFYSTFAGMRAVSVGISSATTYELDEWASSYCIPFRPDYIAITIGTNDIYDAHKDGATVGQNVVDLLTYLHTVLPETQIYYYSIVYRTYKASGDSSQAATNSKVKLANTMSKLYCDRTAGVTYLDVTDTFVDKNTDTANSSALRDGVHPTLENYSAYLDALADAGFDFDELSALSSEPDYVFKQVCGVGTASFDKAAAKLDITNLNGGNKRTRAYLFDDANRFYYNGDFAVSGTLKLGGLVTATNAFAEILLTGDAGDQFPGGSYDVNDLIIRKPANSNAITAQIWGYGVSGANPNYAWGNVNATVEFSVVVYRKNIFITIDGTSKTMPVMGNPLFFGIGAENCNVTVTDLTYTTAEEEVAAAVPEITIDTSVNLVVVNGNGAASFNEETHSGTASYSSDRLAAYFAKGGEYISGDFFFKGRMNLDSLGGWVGIVVNKAAVDEWFNASSALPLAFITQSSGASKIWGYYSGGGNLAYTDRTNMFFDFKVAAKGGKVYVAINREYKEMEIGDVKPFIGLYLSNATVSLTDTTLETGSEAAQSGVEEIIADWEEVRASVIEQGIAAVDRTTSQSVGSGSIPTVPFTNNFVIEGKVDILSGSDSASNSHLSFNFDGAGYRCLLWDNQNIGKFKLAHIFKTSSITRDSLNKSWQKTNGETLTLTWKIAVIDSSLYFFINDELQIYYKDMLTNVGAITKLCITSEATECRYYDMTTCSDDYMATEYNVEKTAITSLDVSTAVAALGL